jgi:hypothetical protein
MNIHQLSVHHDERQDRLLLRLNTQDQQEFRFWLTRRMTLRLMPAIEQSAVRLEAAKPGVAATDAPAQQMLTELKRDDFLKKADFATPFESRAGHWPLGAEPLLITDAHLSIQPGGALEIAFEDKSAPDQARSCRLLLQVSLVHGMLHLIQQASEKAAWGAVESPAKTTETAPAPAPSPPRYAH